MCLLQCDQGFASKGSHIIECDLKLETFDPDPAESVCVETKMQNDMLFRRKSDYPKENARFKYR